MQITKNALLLAHMGLQEVDIVHLCVTSTFLPTLRVVNLENNNIGDLAGCLLVTLLTQYAEFLDTLNLRGTNIHAHTIAALYMLLEGKEIFFKERKLREVAIGNNTFAQEELCKFLVAVSEATTLRVIDISGLALSKVEVLTNFF